MTEASRTKAVAIAKGVLGGHIGIIDGCRQLSTLGHEVVPDWRVDDDFVVFGALDSETDHLPIGEPRRLWDPVALAQKDVEIKRFETRVREDVFAACRSVINRFGTA